MTQPTYCVKQQSSGRWIVTKDGQPELYTGEHLEYINDLGVQFLFDPLEIVDLVIIYGPVQRYTVEEYREDMKGVL